MVVVKWPRLLQGNGAEDARCPGTPGTPDKGDVSNDELLDHLQSCTSFQSVMASSREGSRDSISVATWKAKLKELDDAKAVGKKLKKELQAVSAKNSELSTVDAALLDSERVEKRY